MKHETEMMILVWHCVHIRAESQTDMTDSARNGSQTSQTLNHDQAQCSLSSAEFHKNNLLSGNICVILYLKVCITLENTF